MSFGKMNTPVEIMKRVIETDDEGFKKERLKTVARVRAYREGRHGSERWADMLILCDGKRFEITSVENVKGRGMYLEILAKEVEASG